MKSDFLTYAIFREPIGFEEPQQRLAVFASMYDTETSKAIERAVNHLKLLCLDKFGFMITDYAFETESHIYFIAAIEVSSKVNLLHLNHANRLQRLSSQVDTDPPADLKAS